MEIIKNLFPVLMSQDTEVPENAIVTDYMDMKMGYAVLGELGEGLYFCGLISRKALSEWELTEEALLFIALCNLDREYKQTKTRDHLVEVGLLSSDEPDEIEMYTLTNSMRYMGASVMLLNSRLKELSKTIGGDFYIIPESRHEVLAVPIISDSEHEDLLEMLVSINRERDKNEKKDVLSNTLYRFNSRTEDIEIVGKEVTV